VLYLNDGQNLFDPARAFAGNTWRVAETATRLVRARRVPPMIIVGIDHGGVRRNREYLPVEDALNPTAKDPLGREYAEFVTREVMPFIARHYPIARGASNTGFGGSSYERDRRAQHAMTKPGIFGKLLVESRHSTWAAVPAWEGVSHPAMAWQDLSGVGTQRDAKCGRNQETVANVLKLESILRVARGARRLQVIVEEGATHSEAPGGPGCRTRSSSCLEISALPNSQQPASGAVERALRKKLQAAWKAFPRWLTSAFRSAVEFDSVQPNGGIEEDRIVAEPFVPRGSATISPSTVPFASKRIVSPLATATEHTNRAVLPGTPRSRNSS
jgi:hypothetical protein